MLICDMDICLWIVSSPRSIGKLSIPSTARQANLNRSNGSRYYLIPQHISYHANEQGLLAVPFVLHSLPAAVQQGDTTKLAEVALDTHQRYAEIFRDVEGLMNDHSNPPSRCRYLY